MSDPTKDYCESCGEVQVEYHQRVCRYCVEDHRADNRDDD